jgi:hypothetical protein
VNSPSTPCEGARRTWNLRVVRSERVGGMSRIGEFRLLLPKRLSQAVPRALLALLPLLDVVLERDLRVGVAE